MQTKYVMFERRRPFARLVNPSIGPGRPAFDRHRRFIGTHLVAATLAALGFAAYPTFAGWPDIVAAAAFVLLSLPLALALYVSRTGNLARGQFLSALNLTALAVYCAAFTGGPASFVIAWLAVAPLEAALSGSRRAVYAVLAASGAGLVFLFALDPMGWLPGSRVAGIDPGLMHLLGTGAAVVYAGTLAVAIHNYHMTSRKALMRGERSYRTMAENATDMITRHDADGGVTFVSGAVWPLLDCAPDDLLGPGLRDRVHDGDRALYASALKSASELGDTVSVEFRLRTGGPDDQAADAGPDAFRWTEMRCRPFQSGAEERLEIVAVTRDISERKIQQLELRQARDDALRANQDKGRFLANISHELRTPLNVIIGFSEVLLSQVERSSASDQHVEYLNLIHDSGKDLLRAVNGLLDMSKIEAGKMEIKPVVLDINRLVGECLAMMAPLAEKAGIELNWTEGEQESLLRADRQAIRQILLNLLSNAIKFSHASGKVGVSVKRSKDWLDLVVEDKGTGIDQELLATLTEPFVRGENTYDRSTEGTGLGLSIVQGLIDLHGGEFKLDSAPGMGTTATVRFPVGNIGLEPLPELLDHTSGRTAMHR